MTKPTQELRDFVGTVNFDVLNESKETGRMTVRGVFQRADTKNANGRIYSSSLWERVLNDPKLNEALEGRRMLGEVEHPKEGATSLNRVSHIVTKIERKGDEIIGEAEVLNTPSGQIIQELFRSGVPVGISSRGRGTSINRNGVEYVDENNFHLDTFDFVYKPSTPGAYPDLQESALTKAYRKESTMDDRLTELKRLEVLAKDMLSEGISSNFSDIKSSYEQCIELEASTDSIIANMDESDIEEYGSYADEVVAAISKAKTKALQVMDAFHENQTQDLSRRAEKALAGVSETIQENNDTEQSPVAEAAEVAELKELLREALEGRNFFQDRLAETLELMESDEDELLRRYAVSVKLGEEILSQLKEAENALEDISQEYGALEERYNSAVELIAGVVERQNEALLVKRVREAIDTYPELASFKKTLLSCESLEELQERLGELIEGLDLPTQDSDEVMESSVALFGATEGDDNAVEESTVEDGSLPKVGQAINESRDAEILEGVNAFVDTASQNRGALVANKVIKKAGWK